MTESELHLALKSIACGRLTFAERIVLHRVEEKQCADRADGVVPAQVERAKQEEERERHTSAQHESVAPPLVSGFGVQRAWFRSFSRASVDSTRWGACVVYAQTMQGQYQDNVWSWHSEIRHTGLAPGKRSSRAVRVSALSSVIQF